MKKKLWGGRFAKETNPAVERFTSSLEFDKRLAEFDCQAGIAHAKALAKAGLISAKEKNKLIKGLAQIGAAIKSKTFEFKGEYEDVHTNIQQQLKERIGTTADKLHMARSRNDLVSADTRLFCKYEIAKTLEALKRLQKSMLSAAKKHKGVVMPAYTHLKHAQPTLFAHYILAYVEMIERDKGRLLDALSRLDASPLGAGALCGTSLPIDRSAIAHELGFASVMDNSIDAASDRDYVLETLCCLAILAMHYSRLCEDFIIFSSDEFDLLDIDERFCTGSSMMPHKKNPDTLELIRGACGEIYGNLISALTVMKSLPLAYNRDMQLDKKFLFNAIDVMQQTTTLLADLVKSVDVKKGSIAQQLRDEFLYATDIAEFLIKKGATHSEAHEAVGKLVAYCVKHNKRISQLNIGQLKGFSNKFNASVYKLLNGEASVRMKYSGGGTSPTNVEKALKKWNKHLIS